MYSDVIHKQLFDDLINQSDWHSIIKWINEHGYWFLINQRRNVHNNIYKWQELADFKINITSMAMSYVSRVNNTHSSPRNGVTNLYSDPKLPIEYPGWYGTIEFEILPEDSSDRIDIVRLFQSVGIILGAGGTSNGVYYRYNVIFFEDDWPGLISHRVLNSLSEEETHHWQHFRFEGATISLAEYYRKQRNRT